MRAALNDDPRIKHPELIAVLVDEIGTVVFRGAVGTLRERVAAARDARKVAGVFNVIVDDLRIHPSIGGRHSDDEIRARAIQQVMWDARIRSTHIDVNVAHGHLTLTGYVRDQSESDAATADVVTLTGVVGVTNRIEIRYKRQDDRRRKQSSPAALATAVILVAVSMLFRQPTDD